MPAMDEILSAPWAAEFSALLGRDYVKKIAGEVMDGVREEALRAAREAPAPEAKGCARELVESRAVALLGARARGSLRPVVNATGVVIHTNLGRSPLANEALKAVNDIAGTYSALEYSPEKGARAGRNGHVEWLVCHLTGAEAAIVVNNNAAAVLLALSATAAGREVIVSNGELVEIGDSFRIPDILSFSGARMIAVGCTNSTRVADYAGAITENTAALLKVHPSNFRIDGFVASASREELAELAAERELAFIEDLGSGLLTRLGTTFARAERTARECLEAGVGAVTFSGDKLLGGPQIGVIAGSKNLVDKMRSHQLLRALRVDKMTLAAFEATLRMHAAGRQGEIPVVAMIEASEGALREKAGSLLRALEQAARSAGASDVALEAVETEDAIGGGAFPADRLAGFGVTLRLASRGAESLAAAFRAVRVPIVANIREGRVVFHVRALLDGDEREIAEAFARILDGGK